MKSTGMREAQKMLQLARGAGHEGDARLHDRDLVRHLGRVAPVADGGLGRPRRRAAHLERRLRRRRKSSTAR
ncbi:MAG: hypothetical protein MZV70_15955 [Desulfobacterales bacterium]|nr:hypothetical protein [Desulfobacterales bacterium]